MVIASSGLSELEIVTGRSRLLRLTPHTCVRAGGIQPWRGLDRALAAHLHNDFFGTGWPVFAGRLRERDPEAVGHVATVRKI